jgi:GT2 family glycosyltransferase
MCKAIVYTIIVTYNGRTWIEKCLNSLLNSSYSNHIVVIDNCSSDDTVPFIKQHYPQVQLIESAKNLGFGQGNNIGLEIALANQCEHVFLLNQDAWVEKNTIELLVKAQREQPKFGILSPVHLNGNGSKLDEDFYFFLKKANISSLLYGRLVNTHCDTLIITTPFVNAAAWLISSECLRKTGGFDPVFFHYGEDDNYAQRTIYKGFQLGILSTTRIYHDKTPSLSGIPMNLQKQRNWEWKEFLIHACNPFRHTYKGFVLRRFVRLLLMGIVNCFQFNSKQMQINFWMAHKILLNFSNISKSQKESKQSTTIPHVRQLSFNNLVHDAFKKSIRNTLGESA